MPSNLPFLNKWCVLMCVRVCTCIIAYYLALVTLHYLKNTFKPSPFLMSILNRKITLCEYPEISKILSKVVSFFYVNCKQRFTFTYKVEIKLHIKNSITEC